MVESFNAQITYTCLYYSMSTTHCLSVDPFNSIICFFFAREYLSLNIFNPIHIFYRMNAHSDDDVHQPELIN